VNNAVPPERTEIDEFIDNQLMINSARSRNCFEIEPEYSTMGMDYFEMEPKREEYSPMVQSRGDPCPKEEKQIDPKVETKENRLNNKRREWRERIKERARQRQLQPTSSNDDNSHESDNPDPDETTDQNTRKPMIAKANRLRIRRMISTHITSLIY
jgi:hypothetical protein